MTWPSEEPLTFLRRDRHIHSRICRQVGLKREGEVMREECGKKQAEMGDEEKKGEEEEKNRGRRREKQMLSLSVFHRHILLLTC